MNRRAFFKASALLASAIAGAKAIRLIGPKSVSFSHTLAAGKHAILLVGGKGIIGTPTFASRAMILATECDEGTYWYATVDENETDRTFTIAGDLQAGESGMVAGSIGYNQTRKGTIVFEGASTGHYERST